MTIQHESIARGLSNSARKSKEKKVILILEEVRHDFPMTVSHILEHDISTLMDLYLKKYEPNIRRSLVWVIRNRGRELGKLLSINKITKALNIDHSGLSAELADLEGTSFHTKANRDTFNIQLRRDTKDLLRTLQNMDVLTTFHQMKCEEILEQVLEDLSENMFRVLADKIGTLVLFLLKLSNQEFELSRKEMLDICGAIVVIRKPTSSEFDKEIKKLDIASNRLVKVRSDLFDVPIQPGKMSDSASV